MSVALKSSAAIERRASARPANDNKYAKATVGGIKTACLTRFQLANLMVNDCFQARRSGKAPKLVFASNGHAIALYATDKSFRAQFDAADIVHADGQPVVMASRLLASAAIPERSATTDFIHDAAKSAAAHGLKIFLLGATERVNAQCAQILQAAHPELKIVGRRNGYFKREDEAALCEQINAAGADIVFVGLGVPLEYDFCVRNKVRLKAGWVVTCGGCFNFVTGAYRRAPQWMQTAGLEWLYRLVREPKRLFWRYAVTNPLAVFLLLTRTHVLAEPEAQVRALSHALAA